MKRKTIRYFRISRDDQEVDGIVYDEIYGIAHNPFSAALMWLACRYRHGRGFRITKITIYG